MYTQMGVSFHKRCVVEFVTSMCFFKVNYVVKSFVQLSWKYSFSDSPLRLVDHVDVGPRYVNNSLIMYALQVSLFCDDIHR